MSREEQLALADQIYALGGGEPEISAREVELLRARAEEAKSEEAKSNGFPSSLADDVLADLERE